MVGFFYIQQSYFCYLYIESLYLHDIKRHKRSYYNDLFLFYCKLNKIKTSKTEQRKYVRELIKLIDKGVDNIEHLRFLTYLKDNYTRVEFNHY